MTKRKDPKDLLKVGAPCTYKEEYCALLIEHMSKGYSFESFGGKPEIRKAKDTLYKWVEKYPEFSDAKKIGESTSLMFWEAIGIGRSLGKIKNGCAASYIFNMKNRFYWRDKIDIVTDKNENKTITLKYSLDKKENSVNNSKK